MNNDSVGWLIDCWAIDPLFQGCYSGANEAFRTVCYSCYTRVWFIVITLQTRKHLCCVMVWYHTTPYRHCCGFVISRKTRINTTTRAGPRERSITITCSHSEMQNTNETKTPVSQIGRTSARTISVPTRRPVFISSPLISNHLPPSIQPLDHSLQSRHQVIVCKALCDLAFQCNMSPN